MRSLINPFRNYIVRGLVKGGGGAREGPVNANRRSGNDYRNTTFIVKKTFASVSSMKCI